MYIINNKMLYLGISFPVKNILFYNTGKLCNELFTGE